MRCEEVLAGQPRAVLEPSPDRVDGAHAPAAPAATGRTSTPEAARAAKRKLFLETMQRIGQARPAAPSASCRSRPRRPATACARASTPPGAGLGARRVLRAAARTGSSPPRAARRSATATAVAPAGLEAAVAGERRRGVRDRDPRGPRRRRARLARATLAARPTGARRTRSRPPSPPLFDGVACEDADGRRRCERRRSAVLSSPSAGRGSPAAVDASSRRTASSSDRSRPRRRGGGAALAGRAARSTPSAASGLFAGALLEAGHAVTSVEADAAAVARRRARPRRAGATASAGRSGAPTIARVSLGRTTERFDVVVADPPRAGLGAELAAELARAQRTAPASTSRATRRRSRATSPAIRRRRVSDPRAPGSTTSSPSRIASRRSSLLERDGA